MTAVDLRTRLGLPARDADASHMNVVVQNGDELFSLVVDSVGDVVEVDADRIESTPPTLDEIWREVCAGVIRLETHLLVVLDVEIILGDRTAEAA